MATTLMSTSIGECPTLTTNMYANDHSTNELVYISSFGVSTTVKQASKEVNRKNTVHVNGRFLATNYKAYEVFTSKQSDSDFAHLVAYKKDAIIINENVERLHAYIFANLPNSFNIREFARQDLNETLIDSFYDKLYEHTPIPILKEWMPFIVHRLAMDNMISEIRVTKPDTVNMKIFKMVVRFDYLFSLISKGLKDKSIEVRPLATNSEAIESITGLDSYLNTFTEVLASKIQESFSPKFIPNENEYSQELQDFADFSSLRGNLSLYEAQKSVIQAASNNLDKNNCSFIIGEQGSGKTCQGIGVIMTNNKSEKKMTNIVLCPGHLVEKWKNEILRLAPMSEVAIVDNFSHFKSIEHKIKGKKYKHLWLIFSKETAKFGYETKPAVNWSEKTSKRKTSAFCCPECGNALYHIVKKGKGKSRTEQKVYLKEKSFVKPLVSINEKCINKINKWNKKEHRYDQVVCGAKLWAPTIKDEDSKWIKLGENGWVQKDHMQRIFDQIVASTDTSKEDSKLLIAISDALSGDKVIQRAPKKYPIARFLRQYYKDQIDYLILDEIHQLSSKDSAQGQAFGDLASAAKKVIGLTGTLLNGYASGIFYILFRAFPSLMIKEGYEYDDEEKFSKDYGVFKTSSSFNFENGRQGTRSGTTKTKALPGISPIVFTKFLLENAAFLGLTDIADGLPSYTEIPVSVEMDDELKVAYSQIESEVKNSFGGRRRRGSGKAIGQMIQSLSIYPDQPYNQPPIINPENGDILIQPENLGEGSRNKEEKFLEIVRDKIEAGEKVLVYYHWTNRTDVAKKLSDLLKEEGMSVAILTSSVKAREREAWINKKIEEGIDVLLCNPILVETGLDLLDFTTIIFYQLGYNLSTMRQASRRSWRLSQTKNIEVYFMFYADTIQEQALALMATKLQAAMSIEGKFSEEGLNAMSNNEDLLTQIANSVVEGIKHTVNADVFQKTSITSIKKGSEKTTVKAKTIKTGNSIYSMIGFKAKKNKKSIQVNHHVMSSIVNKPVNLLRMF